MVKKINSSSQVVKKIFAPKLHVYLPLQKMFKRIFWRRVIMKKKFSRRFDVK